ncbi:hypothetical protein QVD17_39800 [Tagetes erecta]|uniref:Uncharacterized protein n=1 Tax=Tagetes erecta TaxID=13708 RepID=A0AAD8NAF7_TARER|nr:hypothetical protein QVD17_39800 [Tagetes erecta]
MMKMAIGEAWRIGDLHRSTSNLKSRMIGFTFKGIEVLQDVKPVLQVCIFCDWLPRQVVDELMKKRSERMVEGDTDIDSV